jgi:hypothetical protein
MVKKIFFGNGYCKDAVEEQAKEGRDYGGK